MNATITAFDSYLPERVVTNHELAMQMDTSDEWIRSHTGITERHFAAPDEAASDLAIEAGRRILAKRGIGPAEIDMVIVASSTTDYPNFPATASIVQDRLRCVNAGAFDLSAGCTGFVYGLELARSLVDAGSVGTVLLIGAEVLTKIANWNDRNSCVLFGDGAGAALIENTDRPGHRVLQSYLRSKGSGDQALIRPVGGSRTPFDPEHHTAADLQLVMDGRSVYLFAVDAFVRTIRTLCDREGIEPADLDWVVPHQANVRIIEAAAKRLGLPVDLFYTNLDRFANTSAASIPIAITEMVERDLLTPGQKVLTAGFGAGLAYGGNLLHW
ncbi:MAG: beta-ketoacyl-ACP synthase III [Alkalispirochaeta sp.]|jgi:3-oxoacyl-[acyl-carrier-protein] synthase-3